VARVLIFPLHSGEVPNARVTLALYRFVSQMSTVKYACVSQLENVSGPAI
jgi:hypothetical protein